MKFYGYLIISLVMTSESVLAGRLKFEKAEAFFNNKDRCVFAVAQLYPSGKVPQDQRSHVDIYMEMNNASPGEVVVSSTKRDGDADFLCIWNGRVDVGTVNEESGCMMGYYNPATNRYESLLSDVQWYPKIDPMVSVVKGKSCTREIVSDLLQNNKYVKGFEKIGNDGLLKRNLFDAYLSTNFIGRADLRVVHDELNIQSLICGATPGTNCGLMHLKDLKKRMPAAKSK